ncbi:patatin-like phospholipase family protein [Thaumasiovibrio sp. DFM-14]|uniref:patatin-like phospholipase family protein n=1 Tax=Thaumasiovibrio sp. DFM-14 TaxID=3384792 RepID=UPI0039A01AA2
MKYILSIDGGGIRGIIPALVLAELEKLTGKASRDLFHLMCGTSTGGIIALGLSVDKEQGLPYSAVELSKIYRDRGTEIFARSFWQGVSSVGGLADETYSSDGLEQVLEEYFSSDVMAAAKTRVMVTTYDIERRSPFFIKSWKESTRSVKMRDAARATSAAPTYFEPALLTIENRRHALIDGGIFVNNPAVSAYAEAKKLYPDEEIKLLSLGTGELVRKIPYREAKDWGKASWALPAMNCMFDGVCDAADYQLQQILGDNYLRMQVRLDVANDDLDDASARNIASLTSEATRLLDSMRAQLVDFIG